MINYNYKFWEKLEPGYYDKNFNKNLLANDIKIIWHYLTFKKQSQFLRKDINHLDFACGPGTLIGQFSKSHSIGYDPSAAQILYAKNKYEEINKIFTDDLNLLYKKKEFDVITINGLFEYLTDLEISELLKEINLILAKKSKIIITTPNHGGAFRIIEFISTIFGFINYKDVNVNQFTKKNIKQYFSNENYVKIKTKKILNFALLFSFFSSKYAIYMEEYIEKIFKNRFGFLLMVEIDVVKNE